MPAGGVVLLVVLHAVVSVAAANTPAVPPTSRGRLVADAAVPVWTAGGSATATRLAPSFAIGDVVEHVIDNFTAVVLEVDAGGCRESPEWQSRNGVHRWPGGGPAQPFYVVLVDRRDVAGDVVAYLPDVFLEHVPLPSLRSPPVVHRQLQYYFRVFDADTARYVPRSVDDGHAPRLVCA